MLNIKRNDGTKIYVNNKTNNNIKRSRPNMSPYAKRKLVRNIEARALPLTVLAMFVIAGLTTVFIINPSVEQVSAATVGDFVYSKKITIDSSKVIGDHSNFPVLINISADADLASHVVNSSGYDIAFFDSTNTTQFAHELISFNSGTGALVCFVNVTNVSGTGDDTYFYIYYGGVVGNQNNPSGVWDSNYLAVYHMNSTYDSTGNYDLTEGNNPAQVAGKVGNCYDFESTDNDYLTHASLLDSIANDAVTFEAYIKPESMDARGGVVGKINDVSDDFLVLNLHENDYLRVEIEGGTQGEQNAFSSAISNGAWYYVALRYDNGTKAKIFCDNATNTTSSNINHILDGSERDFYIGINNVPDTFPFDGCIDEVRVSKIARSDAYLSTVYNNYKYDDFLTIEGESNSFSSLSLNGIYAGIITWQGTAGNSVWCNSSGSSNEFPEINLTINATDNATDFNIWVGDLNNSGSTEYVNASNITLYVSSDNSSFGSLGSFTDGGSNITLNQSSWVIGTMGDDPFVGGLTDKTDSIYLRLKLAIPADTSTDMFYSLTTTSFKIYIDDAS